MIRQCAWCRRVIGLKTPIENMAVTHGICARCSRELVCSINAKWRTLPATQSRECESLVEAELHQFNHATMK